MSVNDLDHYIRFIDSVPVVSEIKDVFLDNFPGVPPPQEIDFDIDQYLDTNPMLIPPYILATTKLKEWKRQLKISLIRVSSRLACPLGVH